MMYTFDPFVVPETESYRSTPNMDVVFDCFSGGILRERLEGQSYDAPTTTFTRNIWRYPLAEM